MSNNEQVNARIAETIDSGAQALLAGIGNHEAKTLAAAILGVQPETEFSSYQLASQMVARQGDDPAWRINTGTINDYCTQTLLLSGVAAFRHEPYRNRTKQMYSATDFGVNRGLPFAGAIVEWSMEHPEHSVQQLLGITATAKETARAPVTSFIIIRKLVSVAHGSEIDVASITRSFGDDPAVSRQYGDHVRRLESDRLVELRSVVEDYNPIYKIDEDRVHATTLTHDVSLAIRDVCQSAPTDEISFADVLDAVAANHPDMPLHDVRRVMTYVVSQQRLPFLEVTNRNGTPINHTAVKPTSEGRRLMEHFIELVDASGQDNQQKLRKTAQRAVANQETFRSLMAKAKHASNSAGSALDRDTVLGIIGSSGEVTNTTLREALATKGLNVSSASIRRFLQGLEGQGFIRAEAKSPAKGLRRKTVHYRIADADAAGNE